MADENCETSNSLLSQLANIYSDTGIAVLNIPLAAEDTKLIKKVWPRTAMPKVLNRWSYPEEVLSYLLSLECHEKWISNEVLIRPSSGTLLLYDKQKMKHYKTDGYDWKTRNPSTKTIREDRTKLKVCGHTLLYGCYTHCESNSNLHRRCYWLIQNPNIVLVHYLDTSKPLADKPNFISSLQNYTVEPVSSFPLYIPLLAVTDQDLCQYLATLTSHIDIHSALCNLSQNIINLSTEILIKDKHATLSTLFTYIKQKLFHKETQETHTSCLKRASSPSHDSPSPQQTPPPHVLLINQAMRLLQLQVRSSQYGDHCLLPKGLINNLSPTQLFKAAATYLAAQDGIVGAGQPHPQQQSIPTTPSMTDLTNPLCPPSLKQIESFFPGPLDGDMPTSVTTPHSLVGTGSRTCSDYNMADFEEFAHHSLMKIRPLEDVQQLMKEQSNENNSLTDVISDSLFQEILEELKVPAASNESTPSLFLNDSLGVSHTHLSEFTPTLELDPESERLLLELSGVNGESEYFMSLPASHPCSLPAASHLESYPAHQKLYSTSHPGSLPVSSESYPVSPLSHYMSTISNEVEHMAHPPFGCHDSQLHWMTLNGTDNTLLNSMEEGVSDSVAMVIELPPNDLNDQFANSFLQQPTSPSPRADTSPSYRSPVHTPSSPSQTSVSSISTAAGESYLSEETPLVAEICELLSESPNVQAADFSHLSLTNSEQQELIQASRVIQNTLRRCNGASKSVSHLREKDAALLIERSYKRYREIKHRRDQAARCIQNQYRLYRKRNKELHRAALFIQQMYRYQRLKKYPRRQ